MILCQCGKAVPSALTSCPSCGHYLLNEKKHTAGAAIFLVAVGLMVVWFFGMITYVAIRGFDPHCDCIPHEGKP